MDTQKLPTLIRPVARHGRTSVNGKRKVVKGSKNAKTVTYVVNVTGTGVGGTAAGSVTGQTR